MTKIQSTGIAPYNFQSQPSSLESTVPAAIIEKAGETIRRTNLQSAAKTPAGAAVAALKYLAADTIKSNVLSEQTKKLTANAAIKEYSKH